MSVVPMLVQEYLMGVENGGSVQMKLDQGRVGAEMLVRIGHVCREREQVEQLGVWLVLSRPDHEDHKLGLLHGAQLYGVNAAASVLGNIPGEIDVPTGVIHIVIVKVD